MGEYVNFQSEVNDARVSLIHPSVRARDVYDTCRPLPAAHCLPFHLACRSLQPLVTFRNIYIMIIVYIYFTSIDVHFVNAAVPAERAWLAPAAVELATLGLYDLAASQLRPHPSNLYVYLKPEAQMEMHTV